MDTMVIVAVAAAVVVVVIGLFILTRVRRSRALRERFGPEYDRTVDSTGRKRAAEAELRQRIERRESLDIRPLHPAVAEGYRARWEKTQALFVDDPQSAVREADVLVTEVMRERGYPMDDFEQRTADISVDHPGVVDNYRRAHDAMESHRTGEEGTEHLRRGMVYYRALFDELLQTETTKN